MIEPEDAQSQRVVLGRHVADAGQRLEGGRGTSPLNTQLHLVVGEIAQLLDAADLDAAGRRG